MPLISYTEALDRLVGGASPLSVATTTLPAAAGLVSATSVTSPGAVPPFRNAALDGYAVRGVDLAPRPGSSPGSSEGSSPVTLPVAGRITAGATGSHRLAPGQAMAITTGAPLPIDADTVVALERSRPGPPQGDLPTVILEPGTPSGANVRGAGEDFAAGDRVVAAGQRLSPEALMALGATGIDRLATRGPVRVAVLTTGDEVHAAGTARGTAGIHDANGPFLAGLLPRAGAVLVARVTAGDRLPELVAALTRLRSLADVIVTTGGVSAGSHDLVPAAVAAAGAQPLFHKVAIRPGKPLLAARFPDGPWLVGLPGNPVAVAVGARFFLVPLLRALLGQPPEARLTARARSDLRARGGLTFFGKARAATGADGILTVTLLPGQESFRVAPLVAANCWVILPPEPAVCRAGDAVSIVPLDPAGDWLAAGG